MKCSFDVLFLCLHIISEQKHQRAEKIGFHNYHRGKNNKKLNIHTLPPASWLINCITRSAGTAMHVARTNKAFSNDIFLAISVYSTEISDVLEYLSLYLLRK